MTDIEKMDFLVNEALQDFPVEALCVRDDLKSLYNKGLVTVVRGESGEFYWRLTTEGRFIVEFLMEGNK